MARTARPTAITCRRPHRARSGSSSTARRTSRTSSARRCRSTTIPMHRTTSSISGTATFPCPRSGRSRGCGSTPSAHPPVRYHSRRFRHPRSGTAERRQHIGRRRAPVTGQHCATLQFPAGRPRGADRAGRPDRARHRLRLAPQSGRQLPGPDAELSRQAWPDFHRPSECAGRRWPGLRRLGRRALARRRCRVVDQSQRRYHPL